MFLQVLTLVKSSNLLNHLKENLDNLETTLSILMVSKFVRRTISNEGINEGNEGINFFDIYSYL